MFFNDIKNDYGLFHQLLNPPFVKKLYQYF